MGINPKILKVLNCTFTFAVGFAGSGVRSASTPLKAGVVSWFLALPETASMVW